MEHIDALGALIEVAPESTVSRTVLKAEGARVVLFAFDTGQELSEHTAAVPILLQVLDGRLRVGADGRAGRAGPRRAGPHRVPGAARDPGAGALADGPDDARPALEAAG